MSADFDIFAYRRNFVRSVPLVLAVPVAIGFVVAQAGVPLDPAAVVAGGVGWIGALGIRAPLAIVVMRAVQQDRFRGDPIVGGASGAAEELVRLVVLLVVGRAYFTAVWVGLGWGALEALWALASGAAILALMGGDPEAEQARGLLSSEEPNAPFWGVLERIWRTLLHMGFTLLVAASPILVVVTVVAHAAINVLALRWGPVMGLARLTALGFAWAAVTLGAASFAWSLAGR